MLEVALSRTVWLSSGDRCLPALVREVLGHDTDLSWPRICQIAETIDDALCGADIIATAEGICYRITPASVDRRKAWGRTQLAAWYASRD